MYSVPTLRFSDGLEAQYLSETAADRLKHLTFSGKLSLLLFVGFLPVDWLLVGDVFREALLFRVLIFAPVAIFFLWFAKRFEPEVLKLPPAIYDGIVVITGLVAALIMGYLSVITQSSYATMYQAGFMPMLIYGNLVQRLRFRQATMFSAGILTIHGCCVIQLPYQPVLLPVSLLLVSVAIYTLFSNFRLELDDRHRYLQDKRTQSLRLQLQQTQAQLAEASRKDTLTGAANRRHFDEYMQMLWNERHIDAGIVSMMLVDVDHFKAYNDRYGHPAGDECLRYVAKELSKHLPEGKGLVARWGGEEFAIVLPGVESAQAMLIGQAMAEGIQSLGLRHESSLSATTVTVSIGLATLEPRLIREPIDNLVARADAALYDAKRRGRNRVERQEIYAPHAAQG